MATVFEIILENLTRLGNRLGYHGEDSLEESSDGEGVFDALRESAPLDKMFAQREQLRAKVLFRLLVTDKRLPSCIELTFTDGVLDSLKVLRTMRRYSTRHQLATMELLTQRPLASTAVTRVLVHQFKATVVLQNFILSLHTPQNFAQFVEGHLRTPKWVSPELIENLLEDNLMAVVIELALKTTMTIFGSTLVSTASGIPPNDLDLVAHSMNTESEFLRRLHHFMEVRASRVRVTENYVQAHVKGLRRYHVKSLYGNSSVKIDVVRTLENMSPDFVATALTCRIKDGSPHCEVRPGVPFTVAEVEEDARQRILRVSGPPPRTLMDLYNSIKRIPRAEAKQLAGWHLVGELENAHLRRLPDHSTSVCADHTTHVCIYPCCGAEHCSVCTRKDLETKDVAYLLKTSIEAGLVCEGCQLSRKAIADLALATPE